MKRTRSRQKLCENGTMLDEGRNVRTAINCRVKLEQAKKSENRKNAITIGKFLANSSEIFL